MVLGLAIGGSGSLAALQAAALAPVFGVNAVSAKVSKDYHRSRLPDGSFQPETYSLGSGGHLPDSYNDPSLDKFRFEHIARILAGPLADQGYVPARDLSNERLIILVFWGATNGADDFSSSVGAGAYSRATDDLRQFGAGAARARLDAAKAQLLSDDQMRIQTDRSNAKLLGYDPLGDIGSDHGTFASSPASVSPFQGDLLSEIEANRYFVILMAYDAQLFRKEKKHKLLWETRFSVDADRNAFSNALPSMAQYAGHYFGQDSSGLVRRRVPDGKVDVGEMKSLGPVDAQAK